MLQKGIFPKFQQKLWGREFFFTGGGTPLLWKIFYDPPLALKVYDPPLATMTVPYYDKYFYLLAILIILVIPNFNGPEKQE